jgi:beta-phosphoglucomutase family hydrolase
MESPGHGVLWDMDGVLVDTGEFHFAAWQDVLAQAGIPFSRELFRQTFGMNNADMIATLLGRPPDPGLVDEIGEYKERLFRQAIQGQARLIDGVPEWLKWLQGQHIQQAVASSAPWENINVLVDTLGIRAYFHVIVSGTDMPGKPDPAVFLAAAAQLGLPPSACLVIEDSVAGVTAARRAGMKCLAVTTTNPAEKLSQADLILENLGMVAPAEALCSLGWQVQ